MKDQHFEAISQTITRLSAISPAGTIQKIAGSQMQINGLSSQAATGDRIDVIGADVLGEVVRVSEGTVDVIAEGDTTGLKAGMSVSLKPPPNFSPDDSWIGRVVDPDGLPLDGRPLLSGPISRRHQAAPPLAGQRRALGRRMGTGLCVTDTLLPLVQGQRVGLFAGSGVGKSTLLATLATQVEADVIVIGLVGERGRELRDFVEKALGPEGMSRTVVIAATSDRPAPQRRKCALAATAVAEHFRDSGRQVLLLIDSVTRFAEAHREIAVAVGELANLRGHPASTPAAIANLCERAGPGVGGAGDITAIYTVLVAGSDMEEPVADMLRGVLDGHIVLDRVIAERGRYPAIDVVRSVSRSLPDAATEAENALISLARKRMGTYARSELMIQAGLYVEGSDSEIDAAIACRDGLEAFIETPSKSGVPSAFDALRRALNLAPDPATQSQNLPNG